MECDKKEFENIQVDIQQEHYLDAIHSLRTIIEYLQEQQVMIIEQFFPTIFAKYISISLNGSLFLN